MQKIKLPRWILLMQCTILLYRRFTIRATFNNSQIGKLALPVYGSVSIAMAQTMIMAYNQCASPPATSN